MSVSREMTVSAPGLIAAASATRECTVACRDAAWLVPRTRKCMTFGSSAKTGCPVACSKENDPQTNTLAEPLPPCSRAIGRSGMSASLKTTVGEFLRPGRSTSRYRCLAAITKTSPGASAIGAFWTSESTQALPLSRMWKCTNSDGSTASVQGAPQVARQKSRDRTPRVPSTCVITSKPASDRISLLFDFVFTCGTFGPTGANGAPKYAPEERPPPLRARAQPQDKEKKQSNLVCLCCAHHDSASRRYQRMRDSRAALVSEQGAT